MKMPDEINISMFAPCGMNCIICYKHCNSKKPCGGCFCDDTAKPKHCSKCKIKACVTQKSFTYCFECDNFPCKLNNKLDRSYEKYNWSLIMNSEDAKEIGIGNFLISNNEYFTCSHCNGIISIHESKCSDCHAKLSDIRLGPYTHFGIIDSFDEQNDYSGIQVGLDFKDCLELYHCITIPDDIINDWWHGLVNMKSYYHMYSRPETALARYGVTLIPKESLDLFIEVIKTHTSERFLVLCEKELADLIELLERAKRENKFVIHYGI